MTIYYLKHKNLSISFILALTLTQSITCYIVETHDSGFLPKLIFMYASKLREPVFTYIYIILENICI